MPWKSEFRAGIAVTVASALLALAAAGPLAAQGAGGTLTIAPEPAVPWPLLATDARIDALLAVDVPFVPQGELLCGGATAAMVLRYHGERGASAESFAHLIRRDEGGIRTDELAAELALRGWSARTGTGDMNALAEALRAGLPPIVLLDSGAGRRHYVVVVALEDDAAPSASQTTSRTMSRTMSRTISRTVRVHDPARSPDVRIDEAEFVRRWEGGRRWMMLVPPKTGGTAAPSGFAASPSAVEPDPSPALLLASERFRAGDWATAAAAAAVATREAPSDVRAWRLLGGSLYLAGHPDDALDAWSRAGEPRVDGVAVSGLVHTRHPVVHALLGLEPGTRLDRGTLERTRRRTSLLPTASLTRVGYRAGAGGWAEVEAVVVEAPAHPLTRRGAVTAALGAVAGELIVWESGLAGAGERLEARWRPGAHGGARLELAVPRAFGLPGRTEAGAARVDGAGAAGPSRHVAAWLRATDWATGWLRWEAGIRADRSDAGPLRPGVTAALHGAAAGDAFEARLGGAAWGGGGAGVLGALDLSLAFGSPAHPWSARLRGGARALGGAAPLDLEPGAGSAGHRPLAGPFAGLDPLPLLRAHASVHGRSLAHAGIEATRWTGSAVRLGLAGFADGAAVRGDGSTEGFADVGLGLRAALADLPGALRLDHAWGLTDGARRWSVGWELAAGASLGP